MLSTHNQVTNMCEKAGIPGVVVGGRDEGGLGERGGSGVSKSILVRFAGQLSVAAHMVRAVVGLCRVVSGGYPCRNVHFKCL